MSRRFLVVKPHHPGRRRAVRIAAAAVVVVGLYVSFEAGRRTAGFDIIRARSAAALHREEMAAAAAANERLRGRVAALETSRTVDRAAYSKVDDSLRQLQQKLQSQQEELAFYRSIVAPEDRTVGLRIQQFRLMPATSERGYHFTLVLVQSINHEHTVEGVVRLTVKGQRNGESAALELAGPDGEAAAPTYSFRYFQDVEGDFVLPEGFVPASIEVELMPDGRGRKAVTRSYVWEHAAGGSA